MWSFDIFDTCLVRRQAFPSDLFLELAQRLEQRLKPALGPDYAPIFREARVGAERLALAACGQEETTLLEIWQQLVGLLPSLDLQQGLQAELDLESLALLPVEAARQRVEQARALHGSVVYISDTYLPQTFIEQELRNRGFLLSGDRVFLSSELRVTKRSGRLFHLVMQQLQRPAASVTHHGDNLHSDVKMAVAAGLRAQHLPEGLLSAHERAVAVGLRNAGDTVTPVLLGQMRAARITSSVPANAAARSLVANFIGPTLWLLAEWVLRRAAAEGVRRLYFFSRDCHGLHRVAQVLAEQMGLGIECRYLRVSRQALLLPAVTEISPAGIPWLRRAWEPGRLGAILAKLELDDEATLGAFAELSGQQGPGFQLRSDAHWARFWEVLGSEPLRSRLSARIEERRGAALAYLQQEGLLDNVPTGMVDLGWLQSCQAALTKLLRVAGQEQRFPAYYLALADGRGAYLANCPAQAIFHRQPPDRRAAQLDHRLFSRIPVLEHVLNCAPHGTIHHYERVGSESGPVQAVERSVSPEDVGAKALLFQELEVFADRFVQPLDCSDTTLRELLASLIDAAASAPAPEWPALLQGIEVADDQNNRDKASMLRSRRMGELVSDALKGRDADALSTREIGIWPELSLLGSAPAVRAGYRRLAQFNRVRRFITRPLTRQR